MPLSSRIALRLAALALVLAALAGCEAKISKDADGNVQVNVAQERPADVVIAEHIDKLELWAGELPQMKGDILLKTAEFRAELEKNRGKTSELRRLVTRVEKYSAEIEKLRKGTGTGTAATPAAPAAQPGGKLGSAPAAGGSGMGGK